MDFRKYDELERKLRIKGHRLLRTYIGYEDGKLRAISTRNGEGEYRWKIFFNEFGDIIGVEENP